MSYSPVLVFHLSSGSLGFLSGAAAISFRKGSRRHRLAGNVFVISMLSMSASATYLAVITHRMNDVCGGLFTFYLVATAWATARHRDGETGIFDWAALLVALAIVAGYMIFGFEAATGSNPGTPAGNYFFMGCVVLLAAAGDVRMLVRGGVSGVQRLVRHLWRMCFALFTAAGALFIGRSHLFPALLRKTNILFFLGILPMILMIYWLFRVRSKNAYERKSMPRGDTPYRSSLQA
jgi:uncharacterized membrane protein